MLGAIGQLLDSIFNRPPKANANDPYRREWAERQRQQPRRATPAEMAAAAKTQIENVVGPLQDHTPMPVQFSSSPDLSSVGHVASSSSSMATLPASKPVNTHDASGSTSTLTPTPQQPSQLPGTVPIPNVSNAQENLDQFMQLLDRSSNLKYNMETVYDRCRMITKLIEATPPQARATSTFTYELTKIDNNVKDITRCLVEWNQKNKYRRMVGQKDMHIQIARFDKAIRNHLEELTAIDGRFVAQHVEQALTGVESGDNQVQDSEFKQHVKDITGFEPENEYILKGKIHHRENIAMPSDGNNFDVYKGQLVEGKEPVAIKIYREKIVMDQKSVRFVERMMRQVSFWTSFQHPSILPCYGVGMQVIRTSDLNFDRFQFYLVSPLQRHGNAPRFIAERRRAGTYVNVLRIIRDAAVGIQYLHGREEPCVHGSMRGENVLIRDDNTACINGFGLTKALSEKKPIEMTGKNFRVRWMAPELLNQDRPPLRTSCDIWAWAMTTLELIAGLEPYYKTESDYGIRDQIVNGQIPEEADYPDFRAYSPQPDMMWALLHKCWNMKAGERPTIDQVIDELDLIENTQIKKQVEETHQWA